jgi:aminoglycoside phosphotransferase (APT) family kinase protein
MISELGGQIAYALSSLWSEPVTVSLLEPFGDGHSGFTYRIAFATPRGALSAIVRLSPDGVRVAGPTDVGRQGRIMAALYATGMPVPRILAADSTGLVNGRSMVLMERVDGVGWADAVRVMGDRPVADCAIRFLRAVGDLDPAHVGLVGEAPTSLTAEVERWRKLAGRCGDELRDSCEALFAGLVSRVPQPGPVKLVHGDFHYGNMLFRRDELAAVLDWEIASLGDQRLDFGCLAVSSLRRRYGEPNPAGDVEVPFGELISMYGASENEARWFVAAACLKYAAILGYNLGLHKSGRRPDPVYEQLLDTMHGLAIDGRAILSGALALL